MTERSRVRRALGFMGAAVAVVLLSVAVLAAVTKRDFVGVLYAAKARTSSLVHRILGEQYPPPDVTWAVASPGDEGLNAGRLDALRASLATHNTSAFLVARDGKLVYEWYGKGAGPNHKHFMSALTKGVVGSMVLMAAMTDGHIRLDDPAWKYIPAWKDDSVRSRIRIRDLAFHTSGLPAVDFDKGAAGDLSGWRKAYYQHPGQRFSMAIHQVPLINPPGTYERYSGIEYYALAYAVTSSLRGTPHSDIRSLYRSRFMLPLGIPDRDWRLSYGASHREDGMTLYAFGSGADMTPRAVLRIGQLLLDDGRWKGRSLVSPSAIVQILTPTDLSPDPKQKPLDRIPLGVAGGWFTNTRGVWPFLPRDAILGAGGRHQVLLLLPSRHVVMLRMGGWLDGDGPKNFWKGIREDLIDPFMDIVNHSEAVGP